MKFFSEIEIPEGRNKLDYYSSVFGLGSCFVSEIAAKLSYYKFRNTINPFGVLFHPRGILKIVNRIVNQQFFNDTELFQYNDIWHHFNLHSSQSNISKDKMLRRVNANILSSSNALDQASHIFITLGTAWEFYHFETEQWIGNCHKLPAKAFKKELTSVKDTYVLLQQLLESLHQLNPKATVLFTVSPVRHAKNGFIQNMQSKAHLLAAVHQLISETANTEYFPSYEIMMDELRDYRFYKPDLLHPNAVAIAHIWERFKRTHISESAYETMNAIANIQNGKNHKPFNDQSTVHKIFMAKLQEKQQHIQAQFPFIKF